MNLNEGVLSFLPTLVILLISLITIFIFVEIINVMTKIKLNRTEQELEKYNIDINNQVGASILTDLDTFIANVFQDYIVLNIAYKDIQYIKSDLEEKINRDVSVKIVETISPIMILKLSTYYNKDKIGDIITEKVYMRTLNYVISNNQTKDKPR